MRKIVPLFFCFIILGCSTFFSRSLYDVIQTVDNFSLTGIIKQEDIKNADKLLSGDASLFIEFGADSCVVAEFNRENEKYTVEAISFLTYKGSLGVFTFSDLPGSYPVDAGDKACKNDKVLQFVKGKYIFSVIPSKDGSMTFAEDLARGLAGRIQRTGIKPDIYAGLPQQNIIEQTGLYFMGPKIFRERFSSGLSDVLLLENIREGVAAKYQTDDGVVDFIKIRYPKTEFAKAAVNSYLKSRADRPVILPRESLQFYTIVEPDRSEAYIADYADWVYIIPKSPLGKKSRAFFEYVLRGGK